MSGRHCQTGDVAVSPQVPTVTLVGLVTSALIIRRSFKVCLTERRFQGCVVTYVGRFLAVTGRCCNAGNLAVVPVSSVELV